MGVGAGRIVGHELAPAALALQPERINERRHPLDQHRVHGGNVDELSHFLAVSFQPSAVSLSGQRRHMITRSGPPLEVCHPTRMHRQAP